MRSIASLLGVLGVVCVLFGLTCYVIALFGIVTDPVWIFGNLAIGLVLLITAGVLNFDALRERMSSGETRRAGKYGTSALLSTVLVIAILGMLGYLASRYPKRFDWSDAQVHSLSSQSVNVLNALERDVEVVALFNPLDVAPVKELLERYAYESPRFKIVEIADPNARPDLLQRFEIAPEQIGQGAVRLASGEESTLLQELTEEKLTNAMIQLSRTEVKKVYFVEGHNERAIEGEAGQGKEGFARAADALRNENYAVEELLLASQGQVPSDANAVIVAGATRPLLRQEHTALRDYLEGGGALLVLLEPQVQTDLVEMIAEWGIEAGDDVVVDRGLALFGRATTPFAGQYDPVHAITKDLRETTLFHMVRSVRVADESAGEFQEIVYTGDSSWAERNLERFFSEGSAEFDGDDLKGPVPIAVAGELRFASEDPEGDAAAETESSGGRLVVFGDADFASNELIEAYRNRDLFLNTVNWLLGDIEAISVRPNRSRASRFQPTAEQFQRIHSLSLLVLPQAIAILGGIVWWSRRNPSGR